MNRLVLNCIISGLAGGVLSHIAAAACSRSENARSGLAMEDVSHIAWGDNPRSPGRRTHTNWMVGSALHQGASIFWAAFFETFFGKNAERSTASAIVGGATIAAGAYLTDYHVVSSRFKPGFEAHLSNTSLFVIYASLAAGLAAAARLRGLYRHQVENRDESNERGNAERRPDAVITPE
jgi:hypothetical protein